MATRREFIKKGSLATLVGLTSGFVFDKSVFGFKTDFSFSKDFENNPIHNFDQKFMESYLNTFFDVTDNNRQFAKLKLIEISKFNKTGFKNSNFDNFSLIFKGIRGNQLKQAVYEFKHSQMGNFSVLLVPITIDQNLYEVVVNKLIN